MVKKTTAINLENGLYHLKKAEIFESMASFCQSGRSRIYNDGLVYEIAFGEYKKATNDTKYKREAKKRMRNLKPYLLSEEEKQAK